MRYSGRLIIFQAFSFLSSLSSGLRANSFEQNSLTDLFICSSQNHLVGTLSKVVLFHSEEFVSNMSSLLPGTEPISS